MVHPDTGETIPVPYRMSFFVPANVPICVGMVLSGGGVRARSKAVPAGFLQLPAPRTYTPASTRPVHTSSLLHNCSGNG